jgi:ABC-type multidrug transport system fused ATPase/permease subunit
LNALSRVFRYIKPQWPRVVLIVLLAVLIGVLFSLSFATILPLLKVMMGEEGLGGWVDRKVCQWRYGVEFYVPETADFTNAGTKDIAYYLLVTGVRDNSPALKAGIRREDRIINTGIQSEETNQKILASEILRRLATAGGEQNLKLQMMRMDAAGGLNQVELEMSSGVKQAYVDYVQRLVSFVPREQSKQAKQKTVITIILAMIVVTVVRCFAGFSQEYLANKVVHTAITQLRTDVFSHSMELPLGFFSSEGTSDTTSRLINDIGAISKGVTILLDKALREPLNAIGTLVFAWLISWQLTLVFLACAPATVGLGIVLGRKIKKATKKALLSSAQILGKLEEAMSAIAVVKVYNRQDYERDVFSEVNRTFLRRVLRGAKIDAATGPIMEVLGMFAGSAALIIGVYWVTSAKMDSSAFFTLLVMLGATAESMRKTSDVWNKVQQGNAAAERIFAVVDMPVEPEKENAISIGALKKQIEFRNVSFSYSKSDRKVLRDLKLTIDAGQTVAVVGPNGAGKTTLVNLLPRFYDPQAGQVLLDGVDIRDVSLKSLRGQISMVSQQVITFNDSVAANIGYGKADATMDEIIAAAKRAYAHEFVEPLPNGYNTVIGEHGTGFSGGQLQRIVIARAILKNPSILIFDEAMSQVDADSEAKIHKALAEIMRNRTCFIIAHRFSTVISADRIVVMNNGRVIAQGVHEELVKDCILYKSLYETQLIIT